MEFASESNRQANVGWFLMRANVHFLKGALEEYLQYRQQR